MKLKSRRFLSALTLSVLVLSAASPAALAASTGSTASPTPASGQALEIAPPVIYLNASPGQTISTQILIRDITNSNLVVTSQINDFVAAGQDGTPKVLLNNPANNPYSMRTWVVPPASLVQVPHQIKTLSVTIKVPADASPGGHYGVIRFTGTPLSLQSNGVSLSASLGALMLMTVSGKITQHLNVASFTVAKNGHSGSFFQSGPLSFSEVVKNSGNVHEQPVGQVTVKDMFGRKLATLPVNQPPGNVLPGSERKFSEALDRSVIGSKKLFGSYNATLKLNYGTPNSQTLVATASFWVIPIEEVAIIIIVLILLFVGLRYGIKRYNRYILNRASNRPPGPPRI